MGRIKIIILAPPNKGIAPPNVDQNTAVHSTKGKIGPTNVVMTQSHVIGWRHKILRTHEEAIENAKILTHKKGIDVITLHMNDEIKISAIVNVPKPVTIALPTNNVG